MVDPLSFFNLRPQNSTGAKPGAPERAQDPKPPETPAVSDSVQLNSLSLRATLNEQAGILKQELPGIIADAVKAPAERDAVRNAPVLATQIRLEKPLQSILDQKNPLPPSLVEGLKSEIQTLKQELPEIRDHALLSSLESDPLNEETLNGILFDVSDQMDRLVDILNRLQ